jgi:wobble nucleotide-excising tRNase
MIESIDIVNFGSFQNFVWINSLRDRERNVAKFKKLNIFYGRNYSGKTTLSRILRSLETGKLPEKYESPSFSVTTSSGIIDQTQIPTNDFAIRVYNKDFIDDHLSFLRDSNGQITSFAIIGSENKTIEQEIEKLEKELGSVDEKTGLRHKYAIKQAEFVTKQSENTKAESDLQQKLINKANQAPGGIKHNSLYRDVNYDIRKLKADIETIRKNLFVVLTEDKRKQKETLLGESPLPDIKNYLQFSPAISSLYETSKTLLTKNITPTKPIQELLDDAILQTWVKEGIPLHRGKRDHCGFCGQQLPIDLWTNLDEHFSKESTDLETDLLKQIKSIEDEKKVIDTVISIDKKDFYSIFHGSFDETKKVIENELIQYRSSLDSIIKGLHDRVDDIFTPQPIPSLIDNSSNITAKIVDANELIKKNNKKTESLEQDQNSARTDLRLSEVAQFIQDIDLAGEEKIINDLHTETIDLEAEITKFRNEVNAVEKKLEELWIQLKDEKKGAEKVNEYLNHYFGHESLCLKAIEETETSAFKFQILRGDKPAYNLSEGECSLVSFCYFVAKLEDTESKGKKLIIFIDDPVSSLDSNHIFFVFSLIEYLIAKAETDSSGNKILGVDGKPIYRYEQLFISTHNLEFLKYLKKLSRPKNDLEQFIVSRERDNSTLNLMPSYLKNYITEFNYLFGEIYTCSDTANAATEPHSFYNFGNNLRKFLEAFLFFKFPFSVSNQQDYNRRVQTFFKDDPSTETLVQRLTNEFSHLGGIFDRSIQPVDYAEISKLAKFVLKKIKHNDKEQFSCLLDSIDKTDPFVG